MYSNNGASYGWENCRALQIDVWREISRSLKRQLLDEQRYRRTTAQQISEVLYCTNEHVEE